MQYPLATATTHTLPNGLTVILDPSGHADVVSAQIWVETGSIHEAQHLGAGVSHFLEHMVFKGTPDFDATALANTVQAAGGHWNAYTSFERTVYYIDGPSASLPMFLKCLTGIVFFPLLPEGDFEKEKDIIRREIDMGLDNPHHAEANLMLETIYQQDPRRHPVIGHRHLLGEVAYADLTRYHAIRYTPDRCFVVISGKFSPAKVLAQLEKLTAKARLATGSEPHIPSDSPRVGPISGHSTFDIPNSRLTLAWTTPALDHPDISALECLATMLGHGRSSRLYRDLREKQALAQEISAYTWTFPARSGIFGITAETAPAKKDALISAIHGQLRHISGPTLRQDLDKAKRQLLAGQFRSLVTASGRATDLASNWHEARNLDFTRTHIEKIQSVTAERVEQFAATLTPDNVCTTILDPLSHTEPRKKRSASSKSQSMTSHRLANGIQLHIQPDSRVPMVHIHAAVRSGLPAETPATNGINSILAVNLPKATQHLGPEEMANTLESLGASLTAHAGNNSILIHAAGFAQDLPTIGGLFTDALTAPAYAQDSIAREAESHVFALREAQSDPLHTAFHALRSHMFHAKGYGLDPVGNEKSLASLNTKKLLAHHRRHFTSENLSICVAGDIRPAAVLSLFEKSALATAPGSDWQPAPSRLAKGARKSVTLAKNQAVIAIGFPAASIFCEDRHALAMLNEYTSDMSGPLFTRIREELGLCYRIGTTQFHGIDTGLFTFYLATEPEQVGLALAELHDQIAKLAQHGIPKAALEKVRTSMLSAHALRNQSPSAIAKQVALDTLFGLPADFHTRQASIYQSLSGKQLRDTAARVFSAKPTVVVVSPKG